MKVVILVNGLKVCVREVVAYEVFIDGGILGNGDNSSTHHSLAFALNRAKEEVLSIIENDVHND